MLYTIYVYIPYMLYTIYDIYTIANCQPPTVYFCACAIEKFCHCFATYLGLTCKIWTADKLKRSTVAGNMNIFIYKLSIINPQ